jgi:hypothetical protein
MQIADIVAAFFGNTLTTSLWSNVLDEFHLKQSILFLAGYCLIHCPWTPDKLFDSTQ